VPPAVEVAHPFKPDAQNTLGLNASTKDQGFTDYDTTFSTDDVFVIKKAGAGDPLPTLQLSNVNFTEQSVGEALNSILTGTGIALVVRGGRKGDSDVYGSVTITNLGGSLADVMEAISQNTGFFYSYNARQKILTVSPNRDFVIFLPPAIDSDTYTGMSNTMQSLGVHSVYQDVNGGTLKFTANRESLEKVQEYLDQIRETRSLLVYDISIYKVQLTSGFKAGIAWSQIQAGTGGALSGGSALVDGLSATFTFSNQGLSQQVIPSLLQSYGAVTTVGNPRLVFLSGTSAYFRQGLNTKVVTNVGNNYGTSINSVTVQTSDIKTGTEMGLSADVSDGTIYTRVTLRTSDIISYTNFTALGTQLTLPTTGDNEFKSGVRSRIGDSVLLGGMIINSASNDISGLPSAGGNGVSLPTSKADSSTRSELVLVLKPHLIRFKKHVAVAGGAVKSEGVASDAPAATITGSSTQSAISQPGPDSAKASSPVPAKPQPEDQKAALLPQAPTTPSTAEVATTIPRVPAALVPAPQGAAGVPKKTVADAPAPLEYVGEPGQAVHAVLRAWCAQAGRELIWNTTSGAVLNHSISAASMAPAMAGLLNDLRLSDSRLMVIDLPSHPLVVSDYF
jgi:hypothetical protein